MTSGPGDDSRSGVQPPALDDVDRAIVAVLREDGRISMRALAARLHISRAGAYLRVQRLEEAGVITGYSAVVNPQRYGYITALRELVLNSFQSMPEVRSTQTVLIFDELEHGPARARPTGAAGPSPGTPRSRR